MKTNDSVSSFSVVTFAPTREQAAKNRARREDEAGKTDSARDLYATTPAPGDKAAAALVPATERFAVAQPKWQHAKQAGVSGGAAALHVAKMQELAKVPADVWRQRIDQAETLHDAAVLQHGLLVAKDDPAAAREAKLVGLRHRRDAAEAELVDTHLRGEPVSNALTGRVFAARRAVAEFLAEDVELSK